MPSPVEPVFQRRGHTAARAVRDHRRWSSRCTSPYRRSRRFEGPVKREDPVHPRAVIRLGIDKGCVAARLNIDEKGNVTNVTIVSADLPRHFDKAGSTRCRNGNSPPKARKFVGDRGQTLAQVATPGGGFRRLQSSRSANAAPPRRTRGRTSTLAPDPGQRDPLPADTRRISCDIDDGRGSQRDPTPATPTAR